MFFSLRNTPAVMSSFSEVMEGYSCRMKSSISFLADDSIRSWKGCRFFSLSAVCIWIKSSLVKFKFLMMSSFS